MCRSQEDRERANKESFLRGMGISKSGISYRGETGERIVLLGRVEREETEIQNKSELESDQEEVKP